MNSEESTFLNNDYKYKVVFLGDSSVGKTSLVDHIINGSCTATHQVHLITFSQPCAYSQLKN